MLTIDHRGFSFIPPTLSKVTLDASLASDLNWEISSVPPYTLWHLDFQIKALSMAHLPSYQLAVSTFLEKVWEPYRESAVGVVLYQGEVPPFELEAFADYLHLLASYLPDELPPIALFDCPGDPLLFSKEIFSHIHLGFRSGPIGVIEWGSALVPRQYNGTLGILLPLREKGTWFDKVDACLKECDRKGIAYRLIAEPYLTEEWDELAELVIFPELISPWGKRMVRGFEAAGGKSIIFRNTTNFSFEAGSSST